MLPHRVPHAAATVLRGENVDLIPIPPPASRIPQHYSRFHLLDLDRKRHALDAEGNRRAQDFLGAARAVQPQRLVVSLET